MTRSRKDSSGSGPSPYLRCSMCGVVRPLRTMSGDPGIALFCRGPVASLLCRVRHHRGGRR